MPPGPVRDGGRVNPLVEARSGHRRRHAAQQRQEPRSPADLGRAGRASLHVGREASGILLEKVVHEEQVDQAARGRVVEGCVDGRGVAHIL